MVSELTCGPSAVFRCLSLDYS